MRFDVAQSGVRYVKRLWYNTKRKSWSLLDEEIKGRPRTRSALYTDGTASDRDLYLYRHLKTEQGIKVQDAAVYCKHHTSHSMYPTPENVLNGALTGHLGGYTMLPMQKTFDVTPERN